MPEKWENSTEFKEAYSLWSLMKYSDYTAEKEWLPPYPSFEQSQAFRDARLAFKKRVNGRTKADH